MSYPVMTMELARSCAQDAANRKARQAGRERWTRQDYSYAAKVMDKLCRDYKLGEYGIEGLVK